VKKADISILSHVVYCDLPRSYSSSQWCTRSRKKTTTCKSYELQCLTFLTYVHDNRLTMVRMIIIILYGLFNAIFTDCSELFDRLRSPSGFYRIRPKLHQEPFLVYCDMEDGGGWTVFQKRRHGKVDFNRDWVDYRDGFGDFKLWNDEFWLGNEHMYSLLSEGKNLVKIDLMDWDGQRSYSFYENFRITDEANKYRLQYGLYSGRAGDALTGGGGMVEQWSACLSGMQFSTRDHDNDRYLQGNCAQENKAGWWFNRCHAANLNGKYYRTGKYKGQHDNGVVWGTWKGLWYSLRHTTMKVRPLVFLDIMGSGAGEI
uniref:Fibrinogen like 1B n=1 Tax=Sander lucioperca TaxID=283035 RepID=A0A8C9ZDT5_SANLU